MRRRATRKRCGSVVALVIIAFLAILIGVVLLANRELCRKARRFGDRRVLRRRPYGREAFRIAYNQHTGVDGDVKLTEDEEEEEKRALNASLGEERAYDADASGDEEDGLLPDSSSKRTPTEEFFSTRSFTEHAIRVEPARPGGDDSRVLVIKSTVLNPPHHHPYLTPPTSLSEVFPYLH